MQANIGRNNPSGAGIDLLALVVRFHTGVPVARLVRLPA